MPLIIICGIPSSGKTIRSNQIKNYFIDKFKAEEKSINVNLINDENLGIAKDSYQDTRVEEKKARGTLLSAVERLVSKDDLVIVDGMNYIKGFRYQLYCVSRAVGTPHCVVHCGTPVELARKWNSNRENGYNSTLFEELVSRFEEPDDRNRWDSPLFTILFDDTNLPFDELWNSLILKKPKPPNLSTIKPISETNYLYELEKTTQEIINEILKAQKNDVIGINTNIKITLTLSELRRLKKQFTNINKMHTLLDMDRVAQLFVEYLNTNLNN
nr:11875_t:CDS:2 [Entrophospora candida]CAG8528939.1 2023_t:CDS:2 [Entrophospora candida]